MPTHIYNVEKSWHALFVEWRLKVSNCIDQTELSLFASRFIQSTTNFIWHKVGIVVAQHFRVQYLGVWPKSNIEIAKYTYTYWSRMLHIFTCIKMYIYFINHFCAADHANTFIDVFSIFRFNFLSVQFRCLKITRDAKLSRNKKKQQRENYKTNNWECIFTPNKNPSFYADSVNNIKSCANQRR